VNSEMKILYTADTHVHPGHLERLLMAAGELRPQVVIIGGDIIPDWKGSIEASIEPHRRWVEEVLLPRLQQFHETFPQILVLLDLGNDDIAAARPLMEARDGIDFHLLHQRVVEVTKNLAVVGYMTVNPTPFAIKDGEKPDCRDHDGLSAQRVVKEGYVTRSGRVLPYALDPLSGTIEDDLDALSLVLESPPLHDFAFIFVSHAPPRDTALDQMATGFHVGSLAVRRFIERWGPTGRLVASLHGHIHEAPWMSKCIWEQVGEVPSFNMGQHSKLFRALLLKTDAITESACLVTVTRAGEINFTEGTGV
jgi:uncharacterized protein